MGTAGKNEAAAIFQYWAVYKLGSGRYDLACYAARLGKMDSAFYWLQQACIKDGVPTGYAEVDPDLINLRTDNRWHTISGFIRSCETYWAHNGKTVTLFILPHDYDEQKPLTVLVWLHGLGGRPDDFQDYLQTLSARIKVGFLCVSGSNCSGRSVYSWSENPEVDYQQIQNALLEASRRVKFTKNVS